jgi:hypothetical protein
MSRASTVRCQNPADLDRTLTVEHVQRTEDPELHSATTVPLAFPREQGPHGLWQRRDRSLTRARTTLRGIDGKEVVGMHRIARMTVVIAALLAAAVVAVTSGAAPPRDPFAGAWVGVEFPIGDGSTDYMVIGAPGANGRRTYLAYETGATFCGGSPLSPLASAGFGYSTGDVLTVTITDAYCFNGSPGAFPLPVDVTMTATSDGHIDAGGVIFSRLGLRPN